MNRSYLDIYPMYLVRSGVRRARKVRFRFASIARTLALRLLHRSDYARWENLNNLETWWDSRTEQVARMVPIGKRVIEFGAGRNQLERYLDANSTYLPSDLVDRGPGTFVCDLNRRPLPDLAHLTPDVAVFGGVLEYLRDLPSIIEWLSGQVSFCVASYAYAKSGNSPSLRLLEATKRSYFGYMNSYTEAELRDLFKKFGFCCIEQETWRDQRLFLFANEKRKRNRAIDVESVTV